MGQRFRDYVARPASYSAFVMSVIYFTRFRDKSKCALFVRNNKLFYKSEMKWVTALLALSFAFFLSNATHGSRLEGSLPANERQEFFFVDHNHETILTREWSDKVHMIKIQIPSMKLDVKFIYDKNSIDVDKNSIDVDSKPDGHQKPKLLEVFTSFCLRLQRLTSASLDNN
ncbi:uncharacterized protein LOC111333925 [Stylophora pistillata]|uniref:uncharacterized protein LOC111333925 n=1 Tax=Stylophora pistillata TaxID=50429 RepID=UPI000C045A6E|nr:uncharacterized protein LOC111333925 [Stylophora pistillata]